MIKEILKKIKKKIIRKKIESIQLINKRSKGHYKRLIFYKNQGINLKRILDIGACNGLWSKMFKDAFPESDILMIEANSDKEEILRKIGKYKIALLGSEQGKEVNYYKSFNNDSGNSIYLENTKYLFKPEKRRITTLKSLLDKDYFDLIKMDVQGSELDIIKGG